MSDYVKHSKLGLIPKDWKGSKLSDIVDLIHGYQFRSEDFTNEGIAVIKIGNVMGNDLKLDNLSFIDSSRLENFSQYKIAKGDILMSLTGNIGRVIEVGSLESEYLQNYRVGKFIPIDNNELIKRYVKYLLSSPLVLSQFFKFSNQSAQANFGKQDMDKVWVTIPTSLPEQQKIAEILSTVDTKIEVIDQQITETQVLKKGLLQRLLTKGIGHTEFKDSALGEIPKSWEVVKIGDVLKLGSGKDYKHLGVGTIPVYGTGGIMTYVDNYLFDGESVGIGRKGTIDKPVLLKDKFWTVDTLFYTHSFNKITPYFVYIVFQSIKWRGYSEATGVPSLSKNIIEPINIPLPTLDEQVKISNILSSIDSKLEVLSEKKTYYQELKQGLMQQLLTGKIRVKTN